ncbi:MAG: fibronectin type III domain-containing protein [Pseudobdellovibrio sp.]
MKPLIAFFVFILALGLSYTTVANETEVCTAEKTENCSHQTNEEKSGASHATAHAAAPHGGEHNELSTKMNSLFPEKHKDTSHSIRPAITKLMAPKFLAQVPSGTVKLQWNEGVNATSYHVQVATDPNFKWLVVNDYSVKGTTYDAVNLEVGKRYFWRVASVKSENESMSTKSLFVSSAFDTK